MQEVNWQRKTEQVSQKLVYCLSAVHLSVDDLSCPQTTAGAQLLGLGNQYVVTQHIVKTCSEIITLLSLPPLPLSSLSPPSLLFLSPHSLSFTKLEHTGA